MSREGVLLWAVLSLCASISCIGEGNQPTEEKENERNKEAMPEEIKEEDLYGTYKITPASLERLKRGERAPVTDHIEPEDHLIVLDKDKTCVFKTHMYPSFDRNAPPRSFGYIDGEGGWRFNPKGKFESGSPAEVAFTISREAGRDLDRMKSFSYIVKVQNQKVYLFRKLHHGLLEYERQSNEPDNGKK